MSASAGSDLRRSLPVSVWSGDAGNEVILSQADVEIAVQLDVCVVADSALICLPSFVLFD